MTDLHIELGSFAESMALQKAIGRALKGTKLELPETVTAEIGADAFGGIIDAVLGVACSDDVEAALFDCAKRCYIESTRTPINREFFESAENRAKYYPIMIEVIKANVGPFFAGLTSSFGGLKGMLAGNQKPK